MKIEIRYQMPELLMTGALFLFANNDIVAWVLFGCSIISAIVRTGITKNEKEEDAKAREEQWEKLRHQLMQAQIATITVPGDPDDDDIIKH